MRTGSSRCTAPTAARAIRPGSSGEGPSEVTRVRVSGEILEAHRPSLHRGRIRCRGYQGSEWCHRSGLRSTVVAHGCGNRRGSPDQVLWVTRKLMPPTRDRPSADARGSGNGYPSIYSFPGGTAAAGRVWACAPHTHDTHAWRRALSPTSGSNVPARLHKRRCKSARNSPRRPHERWRLYRPSRPEVWVGRTQRIVCP